MQVRFDDLTDAGSPFPMPGSSVSLRALSTSPRHRREVRVDPSLTVSFHLDDPEMFSFTYDLCGNLLGQASAAVSAPKIKGQPLSLTAAAGQIATFSVVVENAQGVTFQWKFNGTAIPGATGDSLLLTNLSVSKGGQYSVIVTNSAGSVTSNPATLTVSSTVR
jgi:hypothetical protein